MQSRNRDTDTENKHMDTKGLTGCGTDWETEIDIYIEKAVAPHSSTLAWKIPWTEEPGRLQSMGSLRVGHD